MKNYDCCFCLTSVSRIVKHLAELPEFQKKMLVGNSLRLAIRKLSVTFIKMKNYYNIIRSLVSMHFVHEKLSKVT